VKVERCFSCS